jgi:hypothetical protein
MTTEQTRPKRLRRILHFVHLWIGVSLGIPPGL